jgi:hypothetical protein
MSFLGMTTTLHHVSPPILNPHHCMRYTTLLVSAAAMLLAHATAVPSDEIARAVSESELNILSERCPSAHTTMTSCASTCPMHGAGSRASATNAYHLPL